LLGSTVEVWPRMGSPEMDPVSETGELKRPMGMADTQ